MIVRELRRSVVRRLMSLYPEIEAKAIEREVTRSALRMSPVEAVMHEGDEVSQFAQDQVDKIMDRLLRWEPVQYVTGQAWFYGYPFKVTPATLIPRPETEELVDVIVKQNRDRSDLRVLDICTGSGCIAIALARALRFPQVTAIELFPDTLAVAKENAKSLKAKVNFVEADALHLPFEPRPRYDIIVSNPPYVGSSEKAEMRPNVTEYEPDRALYVPDDDPLKFYRAILDYAVTALTETGRIYLEINPLHARDLERLVLDRFPEATFTFIPDTPTPRLLIISL
ncbi:MAG: peptide chain release factor N(5)-glutamine methyltransferase [Bacteroidales bacterium]|nr:peptide chain release factor N(5)-glutamine methyltransferase [Bacteroidales bacterium]MCD8393777.1 peptide chain release factor N(5)-glutamine methyltransferase [Bacteroidales bacterium]